MDNIMKLDGKTSYGYQYYNQLNNGIKRRRAEIGLDTEGYLAALSATMLSIGLFVW